MERTILKSLAACGALVLALMASGCATTGYAPTGYMDYCGRHPGRAECRN